MSLTNFNSDSLLNFDRGNIKGVKKMKASNH